MQGYVRVPPAPASMSVHAVADNSQRFVGGRNLLDLRKAEIYPHGKVWPSNTRATVMRVNPRQPWL